MEDIYVLNKNLETIGVIDTYKSCIWSNRYNELGDCELYLEATVENVNLIRNGTYLMRNDDDMLCKVEKIEVDTSVEDGDYLIITGVDSKHLLHQRIIWGNMNCNGKVEDFIRDIITKSMINPSMGIRKFLKENGGQLLYLGEKANLTEVTTEQVSYDNIEEKVQGYCKKYNWGYKIILKNYALYFYLYKGTDRSENVVFSEDYENLETTKYIEDNSNLGNSGLIEAESYKLTEEASQKKLQTIGNASSTERYEIFIDESSISNIITWGELTTLYPNGSIILDGSGYVYKMSVLNIQIVDQNQLTYLRNKYPNGTEVVIDGNNYYRISNVIIADLKDNNPLENDNVMLRDDIYFVYLLNKGYEHLSEYGSSISFDGAVEPNTTFEYKKDYFLGDLVTVENKFGISSKARIVEVIEVHDENGYSVEPKFEYLSEEG